jgi:hypothetical protein
MLFSGILRWRDDGGHVGEIARFEDIEATDENVARAVVIDEGWDPRLDSACCVPVVEFFACDEDDDEDDGDAIS